MMKAWPVMGTQIHPLLEDRTKVSFLPASRMHRELVLLAQKNLERSFSTKWREPVHQLQTKMTGVQQVGPGLLSALFAPLREA